MRLRTTTHRIYRPSTEAERRAELASRNANRHIDYCGKRLQHLHAQRAARIEHQQNLRCAYVQRRVAQDAP